MPTYDYKCIDCEHTFEQFQKMTDEPISICPECGGSVKRLIGAGLAPIFKGTGFYQTDYKSNNNGSSEKKTSKESDNSKTKKDVPSTKSNKEVTSKAS